MFRNSWIVCCRSVALVAAMAGGLAASCPAQISFSSAISLAVQNSPRMKIAQDDVHKSYAVLAETRDVFIPSIMAAGGVGASYGITLNVPTIFTISAQSLVVNYSQRDYVRAARLGVQAATLALKDVREQVEEDAATTYLSLNHAQEIVATVTEEHGFAQRLVAIEQDRVDAGVENALELKKARRTALQLQLQRLQLEDEVASLRDHMSRLLGLPGDQLVTVPESVPSIPTASPMATISYPATAAVLSAEANARAKQRQAYGDSRYTWRPQLAFEAQYGRISPINNVAQYYRLDNNYNSAEAGVQIQFPFLDAGRKAKAQESMADAQHALHEAEYLREQQSENRLKLQHSIAELMTKMELATVEQEIAQDQLSAVQVQTTMGSGGGTPMTPRDEENAHIQERQKYLNVLDASLQLQKAQIALLRQTGELAGWLQSVTASVKP